MSGPIDWAFAFVWSRVFKLRPRISKIGNRLVATSGGRGKVLSLGLWLRTVSVDPTERVIRVNTRIGWFFPSSRTIHFDRIKEVLYAYGDMGSAATHSWNSHHSTDVFTVGLLLDTGEEIKLFRFVGEGDFYHDGTWPDWMYWDDIIQGKLTSSTSDGEAMQFADMLAAMIDVPIGNPVP